MKNNNGKVAIAIVAMFVVALSVVGFTYAYFTAQVQNNKADKSVEVTAGIMQVDYDFGRELVAKDIVPGWISDNFHYYDPVLSVNDKDGVRQISSAILADVDTLGVAEDGRESAYKNISEVDALELRSKPVTFTVTNTGTKTAKYAIKLNVNYDETKTPKALLNTFDGSVDKENLLVYLIEGEWNVDQKLDDTFFVGKTGIELFDENNAAKTVIELSDYQAIEAGGQPKNYYVVLRYKDSEDDTQNVNMGKVFVASVEVVGLGQDAQATVSGNE